MINLVKKPHKLSNSFVLKFLLLLLTQQTS
jgi:hypothetical protein